MGARPELQQLTVSAAKSRKNGPRTRNANMRGAREAAAHRLLNAERSVEIFPILLEESSIADIPVRWPCKRTLKPARSSLRPR